MRRAISLGGARTITTRPSTELAMPHLDVYDYLTLASLFVFVLAGLVLAVIILGLPGKIALKRKHPDAEAVNLMGWAGFMTVIPWINALIWAFKPTNVVDIRRGPREEQAAIAETLAQLEGTAGLKKPESAPPKKLS